MHYYSTKNAGYVTITGMNTQHILNAISKVRNGNHWYYDRDSTVLVGLLTELEARNAKRMTELEERLNHYKKLALALSYGGIRRSAQMASAPVTEISFSKLDDLRQIALTIARQKGLVTADTLRTEYAARNSGFRTAADIGPYLPYVFRDSRFKQIGFLRSTFPRNKGRFINVWTHRVAV